MKKQNKTNKASQHSTTPHNHMTLIRQDYHKTRQDITRQDNEKNKETRPDKTRQDKTRQDKTRQDKTRQETRSACETQ